MVVTGIPYVDAIGPDTDDGGVCMLSLARFTMFKLGLTVCSVQLNSTLGQSLP